MDNTVSTYKLHVPADKETRWAIQHRAKGVVHRAKVMPPANLTVIEALAREVISELGFDPNYLEFAMVVCGNEIWRPVVEAVPFDRRLLLLPQCLRDSNACQAASDELGLLCAGCKQCNLDEILDLAESLGYTTLVAEGTTVAVSLVEEGAVDAVIGVSCMDTLQKSFAPVAASGIPVLGIPLLDDGCIDTHVDLKALKQEIANHRCNEPMVPVSLSNLKDQIERLFTGDRLLSYFENESTTAQMAIRSLLEGGRRMRPLLAQLSYYTYLPNPNEQVADDLAFVIECFHKASLVHDDIEDSDDFRYEKETLHRKEGLAVAINVGDLLVGKGYQVLASMELEPQKLSSAIRMMADSHVDSSLGQGSDLLQSRDGKILSVEDQLEVFRMKTGSAIKASLLLGAIVGGASQADWDNIALFASCFGIAYQIGDDLHEFRNETGPLNPADFPFLMSLLSQHSTGFSPEALRQQIASFKIEEEAERYLNRYIDQSYQTVDLLSGLKIRLGLHVLLGNFFKRNR